MQRVRALDCYAQETVVRGQCNQAAETVEPDPNLGPLITLFLK
jgi:hypothetical protein